MTLPTFREIREVQSTSDANAYLEAHWLLIECQARQATDSQGADGYIVYVIASTDHSWDPFGDEAEEERYERALAAVESFEEKHGSEKAEKIRASKRGSKPPASEPST
jgi:hypothetical protein